MAIDFKQVTQQVLPEAGQTHVHEFLGSTMLAEEEEERHNHRFASVSSEAIPLPDGSHRHGFQVNTDFFLDHHHELADVTGPAIPVSPTKHVHFVDTLTTQDDGHFHEAIFATLIESPLTTTVE